jgi:hypothetical protein
MKKPGAFDYAVSGLEGMAADDEGVAGIALSCGQKKYYSARAKQLRLAARLLRVAGRADVRLLDDGAAFWGGESEIARIIHWAQKLQEKSK